MANRLTQEALEALQKAYAGAHARVTQTSLETLQGANAGVNTRLTQAATETLQEANPNVNIRLTQVVVETISSVRAVGSAIIQTMPSFPSVKSIEFTQNQIVASVVSPFTGQQQLQDWQAGWAEASLELPPMESATAAAWVAFIMACKGPLCVFQLPSVLAALVPTGMAPAGYWRLKNTGNKWSVQPLPVYGMRFEIREAI